MYARLERVRAELASRRLDALLVHGRENQEYLVGFTGFRDSSLLVNSLGDVLVTGTDALVFPLPCDFPIVRDAVGAAGFTAVAPGVATPPSVLRRAGARRVGVETGMVSHARYCALAAELDGCELVAADGVIERLRAVKDAAELGLLQAAAAVTDAVMAEVLPRVRPGTTEIELAIAVECGLRRRGALKSSFDVILTSGPRTALVHAAPTTRALATGDLVLIDFGAGLDHYYSDLTRSVTVGAPAPEQAARHAVVMRALDAVLQAARPGIRAGELDRVARRVITDAGYGQFLAHSVGHGVGRAVHEPPWLRVANDEVLEADMVLAIEPGLYIPGWGGIRIEDTVRLTRAGCERLTNTPLDLSSLGSALK